MQLDLQETHALFCRVSEDLGRERMPDGPSQGTWYDTGMQMHLAKEPSGRAAKHSVPAITSLDADLETKITLAEVPTGSVEFSAATTDLS